MSTLHGPRRKEAAISARQSTLILLKRTVAQNKR